MSVIIPYGNKPKRLEDTLDALLHRTGYSRLEIIVVVDDPSPDPDLASVYAQAEAPKRVRFVPFSAPFTHSAACNFGARAASGAILLFLHFGIEVTAQDWLEELVRRVERPGAGVVGTMLVSPDGDLLQTGAVVEMDGGCGPILQTKGLSSWGVFGAPSVPRNYLAISGACQMVRRDVFDDAGGYDETYRTANADGGIALSIAVRRLGYRNIYTPFAKLISREDEASEATIPTGDHARLIRDLDAFGIVEDPFFHPALELTAAGPILRGSPEDVLEQHIANTRAGRLAAFPDPSRLDIFDSADVIAALGRDHAGKAFWDAPRPPGISDAWSAMRFIVSLIRRDTDLRARFPYALSEGENGAFAQWLLDDAQQARFSFSDAAKTAIRTAFTSLPADRVRRAYLFRDDIRTAMPLGCTPIGLKDLFVWLVKHGGREYGLRIEAIWWFALECTERPAWELVHAYGFNPEWQRIHPDGLTVFGRRDFASWLRTMHRAEDDFLNPDRWPVSLSAEEQIRLAYNCRDAWQKHHPDAFASVSDARRLLEWLASGEANIAAEAEVWLQTMDLEALAQGLARNGVNILGHFCYPSGLRTSAESIVEGLRQAGKGSTLRDIWVDQRNDDPNHISFNGLEVYDTTIIHVQPDPFFSQSYRRCGLFERQPRTYRIAYWYWELDEIPTTWLAKADEIDEIWVATRFVGDAARACFDKPVHEFLPGLELPAFDPLPRVHCGRAARRFIFLFVFHMTSIVQRKNPLGLIRAFRKAFGDKPEPLLVLKTSFGAAHPEFLAEMYEAAAGEGIEIIDEIYSPNETLSIIKACDCYVSLHRSEGYGLTMAEAMLLGKPVVATAYSGNLDFMTSDNSLLVDKDVVVLDRDYPPYAAGSRWAEPSTDHAASCMKRVYENQEWAQLLGAHAKADLTSRLSHAASGKRMAARLEEIDRMRFDGRRRGSVRPARD